jgi:hypothetical protein
VEEIAADKDKGDKGFHQTPLNIRTLRMPPHTSTFQHFEAFHKAVEFRDCLPLTENPLNVENPAEWYVPA